jgi:primosomal protein N' (replication factor Y) (superfamily II helicase)
VTGLGSNLQRRADPGDGNGDGDRAPVLPRGVANDVVEVAVTLPVAGRFHYRVPARLRPRARVGARVLVRFGGKKVTGVVVREGAVAPADVTLVEISELLDDDPALPADLVELCMWIADYYEAPPGEVVRAALPAGSGVGARRVVSLTEAGRIAVGGDAGALPAKLRAVLARLEAGPIATAGLSSALKRGVADAIAQGFAAEGEERDRARARLKRERVASWKRAGAMAGVARGNDAAASAVGSPGTTATASASDAAAAAETDSDSTSAIAASASASDTASASASASDTASASAAASDSAAAAEAARAAAGKSPKRRAVLDVLIEADGGPVAISELNRRVAGASAALRELVKVGLAEVGERETSLDAAPVDDVMAGGAIPTPTDEQAAAIDAIVGALREPPATFSPFLLHGVTGSGKTEVYLRVIAETLGAGKTAVVLVPEISLTPQLAARFRARFGDEVAILHSGLSEQARLGEWSRLRRGQARIAVGARSAVFAPLANIGVIVVDEEHDGSFKQEEGVRYHARDVALVRAQRAGAVCVLGSATPSLESFAHARRGGYRLLTLSQRPTARPMPTVDVVDLRVHIPDGDAMLSNVLRDAIGVSLAAGDQSILFLNRRGFATFVLCRACGHSFRCPHCAVSLTYHRHSDRLTCHYCGYVRRVPEACPECKTAGAIVRKGLGTERVAEAVAAEFPHARVARLDRDVASGAKIEAVLARVARREIDILVGTQMVTKGHDFPGVTLVGVLCADTGLDLPDFRASERTFQLLAQVAGRAGRGERAGRVIVQTYRPGSSAVVAAAAHDYTRFFDAESATRAELGYPPHGRLIAVRIDGADEHAVAGAARKLADVGEAMALAGVELRGPVPAPLEKLRNRTRWQIWLRGADRAALRRVARAMAAAEVASGVRVVLDVDPMSSL